MPDKKLTDAEIKKGLECISGEQIYCKECKYSAHLYYPECRQKAARDALDLINRLQAEIERLKKVNLTLEKCCENCIHEEKTLQTHPCCECFGYRNFTPKDFLKQIKAEAHKEVFDKLMLLSHEVVSKVISFDLDEFYDLKKEMVGDN